MKKRLLVIISLSNSIRYFYRTGLLKNLQKFCEPVIVMTWHQQDFIQELKKNGFEVHVIEPSVPTVEYQNLRRKIDIWFDHYRLQSPSKKIQENYLDRYKSSKRVFIKKISKEFNVLKFRFSNYAKKVFKEEEYLLNNDINYLNLVRRISDLNIDAVFTVTPFHQQEDFVLRACKMLGKKMITSILSFDNITKRGWIPVPYDVYMVWNKYNAAELERIYPDAIKNNVHITGAPQFDFYYDSSYIMSREAWLQQTGLKDIKGKIILYAGGPAAILPNETQYVRTLAEAIHKGIIPRDTTILFRCHPIDRIERWREALADFDNIVFESSWTGSEKLVNANITDSDIIKLCSTLAYTDVHINFCSTMTVDGSAYHKPQIAPYYDDVDKKNEKRLQYIYEQEHFLPILNTGGLALAHSKEQLIQLVNRALETPCQFNRQSTKIVEEIITYTDGHSTDRVIKIIQKALEA
jgi:hypothetical protein